MKLILRIKTAKAAALASLPPVVVSGAGALKSPVPFDFGGKAMVGMPSKGTVKFTQPLFDKFTSAPVSASKKVKGADFKNSILDDIAGKLAEKIDHDMIYGYDPNKGTVSFPSLESVKESKFSQLMTPGPSGKYVNPPDGNVEQVSDSHFQKQPWDNSYVSSWSAKVVAVHTYDGPPKIGLLVQDGPDKGKTLIFQQGDQLTINFKMFLEK